LGIIHLITKDIPGCLPKANDETDSEPFPGPLIFGVESYFLEDLVQLLIESAENNR
jgi:hypothetical protein